MNRINDKVALVITIIWIELIFLALLVCLLGVR